MKSIGRLTVWCWDEVGAFTNEDIVSPSGFSLKIEDNRDVVVTNQEGSEVRLHGGILKVEDLTVKQDFLPNGDSIIFCTWKTDTGLGIRCLACSIGLLYADNEVPDRVYTPVMDLFWKAGVRVTLQKSELA